MAKYKYAVFLEAVGTSLNHKITFFNAYNDIVAIRTTIRYVKNHKDEVAALVQKNPKLYYIRIRTDYVPEANLVVEIPWSAF